jgi:branched-chain amino acid transport system substrate-binding protein
MHYPSWKLSALLPIVLSSLSLTGCQKGPVKVAMVIPLSGEDQIYGASCRKGLELALEELNTELETPRFEAMWADSESSPKTAARKLAELYEAKAFVAIGGLTSREAATMVPVAEDHERALLSPSALNTRLASEASQFYRIAPSDQVAGNVMADFLSRKMKGISTAAAIAQDAHALEAFEHGFRPTFEGNGGEVLAVIELSTSQDNFNAEISRVVKLKPDAIYLAGHGTSIGDTLHRLRTLRYRGKILTDQSLSSPAAIQQIGTDAVGVLITRSVVDAETNERAHAFVERFQEKYGEEPDLFAAEAYDTLMVLARALEGRPPYPGELHKGLRDNLKGFMGVTGAIEFNAHHSVTKYPRVYSVAKNLSLQDEARRLEKVDERRRKRIRELKKKIGQVQQAAAG